MKTALIILLATSSALVSGAVDPAPAVRMAIFDFQADAGISAQFGVADAGKSVAALLATDLSGFAPFSVVDRGAIQEHLDPASPIAPADAKRIGAALEASTLVDGRVYQAGAETIIAAKVVSAESGQTLGTMVTGDRSTAIADLIARLAEQVGTIAQVQNGLAAVPWSPAGIVGSRKAGSLLAVGEVACVLSVDGRVIPDETDHWDEKQPLLPGLHEIFVRYYDGTHIAGHDFVIDARPGASYEVASAHSENARPTVWIEDLASHKPVTDVVEASTGSKREAIEAYQTGPFGYIFPRVTPTVTMPQGK